MIILTDKHGYLKYVNCRSERKPTIKSGDHND